MKLNFSLFVFISTDCEDDDEGKVARGEHYESDNSDCDSVGSFSSGKLKNEAIGRYKKWWASLSR